MRSGYVRGIYRPYLAMTQENVGVRGRGARAPSANRAPARISRGEQRSRPDSKQLNPPFSSTELASQRIHSFLELASTVWRARSINKNLSRY